MGIRKCSSTRGQIQHVWTRGINRPLTITVVMLFCSLIKNVVPALFDLRHLIIYQLKPRKHYNMTYKRSVLEVHWKGLFFQVNICYRGLFYQLWWNVFTFNYLYIIIEGWMIEITCIIAFQKFLIFFKKDLMCLLLSYFNLSIFWQIFFFSGAVV